MQTRNFLGFIGLLALAVLLTGADNIDNGFGNIAYDDVGGELMVQRVKLQVGADGSATDLSLVAPLPVRPMGTVLLDFTSTGTSPVNLTWNPSAAAEVHQIQFTLTGATGTSQSLTVVLNAVDGPLFAPTFLGGTDGDMTGLGSLVYTPPERPLHLSNGSKLDIDWPEDSGTTWALKIKYLNIPLIVEYPLIVE